jgi:DNA polymerase-3 subunit gamma/tau
MSYLVLARKWRPRQFNEVVAQEHVTRTLENAIKQNRLASAYLFTGPRGVGKTTMARLLAKAANCEQGPTTTPCDACTNCVEITDGRNLDVLEIDGASNRGIDEVRNLRENARYTPTRGKRKIYIIDEVHMLTEPAFNALLKTLEEPPPHVLFIFATTEVHKVPATILSRCQRFDFRRVPLPEIVAQLKAICEKEKVEIDDASLALIAKKAEGSMRDSQSLLDQVIAYCGEQVRREEVAQLFGMIDQDLFFACTDAIAQRDVGKGLELSEHIYTSGYHLGEFLDRLAEHFSNVLTTRVTDSTAHLFGLDGYVERYQHAAALFSEVEVLRCLQMITDTQVKLSRVANPRVLLEMLLLKMIQPSDPTGVRQSGQASIDAAAEDEAPAVLPKAASPGGERGAGVHSAPHAAGAALQSSTRAGEDNSKKKPQTAANHHEPSGLAEIDSAKRAEPGISVIPQIVPAAAREDSGERLQEKGEERRAKSEEYASYSTFYAPRSTTGSLFDHASLPGIQKATPVKVPVVQAKEPPIPRLTNVKNEKEALAEIQRCWFHILEQVKVQRISLGSFLELGLPTGLSDGTLEICFDQGNGFQINSVNNQKTFIQEIIKRETGYRVRIVCRKEEVKNLNELRAQVQAMGLQSEVSSAGMQSAESTTGKAAAIALEMAPASAANDSLASAIPDSARGSEQAASPANGASKISQADPAKHERGVASRGRSPASLEELYEAYPTIKKLVEALDGELV